MILLLHALLKSQDAKRNAKGFGQGRHTGFQARYTSILPGMHKPAFGVTAA